MAFKDIFKNSSDYNEKTIIGFMAFAVMTLFAMADIGTGIFGLKLEIQDFIYHGFELITLGSFGIAGVEKFSSTEHTKAKSLVKEKEEDFGPDPE